MPDPVKPPPPPQELQTVEELYYAGLRLEQFFNPALEPDAYYEEALRRDPDDSRVNRRPRDCGTSNGDCSRTRNEVPHGV